MEETIYSVTAGIIKSLDSDLESSYTKSILAELRNSINRDNDYSGIVWQLLFDKLPKDFLNNHRDGNLTKEESVILNTLQLYSVHQQGKNESVNLEEKEYVNDAGHFCVQYDGHNYHLDMKNHLMINLLIIVYSRMHLNYLNMLKNGHLISTNIHLISTSLHLMKRNIQLILVAV